MHKEGNDHHQYNKFRSACELLETVGAATNDTFEEMEEDQSTISLWRHNNSTTLFLAYLERRIKEAYELGLCSVKT